MQAAHHVGRPGAEWIGIAVPYQWLCRQMQHHIRLSLLDQLLEGCQVGQISDGVMPALAGWPGLSQLAEEVRLGVRLQCVAPYLSPKLLEPEQQPAALEARVPCEQNALTSPECSVRHHHTFQGAFAFAQRSSR